MLVLNQQENKLLLQLKRDNMQVLFRFQHDRDLEEIKLAETEIIGETENLMQ